ncbi:RsiV family protein [Romboutsia sp. 1001713B170131_170501_G6]|uniref:RsiV family protein n=1 Tax=Romboutsia sp. 1001713B170131_170501_G6 TaxID=2787108 RepID=UPI0018A92F73|nr:RsiV family protein [Romboutsia sp. 1001713B170131_170501_G6]
MLYVDKNQINEVHKGISYNLNYPIIQIEGINHNNVDKLNKDIYEDVEIFKEVIELQNEFDYISINKNIISEYNVHFNTEDMISIVMEFSQVAGLYGISYINSYNYDLKEDKYITLDDLFKKDSYYIKRINEKIIENIDSILERYCYDEEDIEGFLGISKDQSFYIEENAVVICFSSYEFDKLISTPIEFKISFYEFEEHLSNYTKKKIYKK